MVDLLFHENVDYGSCDACWYVVENGVSKPIIALEGTDALNRKSSGNAQYQRFHHALGAVKNNLIGVYYLKKGIDKIQEDLYGIAYFASQKEQGTYLIIDDLQVLKDLLNLYDKPNKYQKFIDDYLQKCIKFSKQNLIQIINQVGLFLQRKGRQLSKKITSLSTQDV